MEDRKYNPLCSGFDPAAFLEDYRSITQTYHEPPSHSCTAHSTPTGLENYFNDHRDPSSTAEQHQGNRIQSGHRPDSLYRAPHGRPPLRPQQCSLHFVQFKANRIDVFYAETPGLKINDLVIVEGDGGFDLDKVVKLNVMELEANVGRERTVAI